ncbi:MAG: hypothetical protein ACXADC_01175 [Candidatus Thorarchaeota archaeon]|jgi:tRNA pseudouridine-54 N-methylase
MTDRRFLVLFDSFPIEEAQVRTGENVQEVIVASRCVNVALFISRDLRRNVSISIAWGEKGDLRVITFPGKTLKRVSPDERSISFFLLKASRKVENLSTDESAVMDNGIEVKRKTLAGLLEHWGTTTVYAALIESGESDSSEFDTSGVFMYEMRMQEKPITGANFIALPRPRSPERFILDINLKSDR